ncbi:MAG: type II toxin-antitoxin system VapC family toxin [bacterium]|nr:type II toxin-antitoxin system VapC family toxin [bacterium]
MGLVLDSSVIVAAERRAQPVSELLDQIRSTIGVTEILLSAISVIELEHGLWRADTAQIAQKRRAYLDTVFAALPVEPFTKEMAQLAAKIDAESRTQGIVIPFADLQIGVTALHYSYSIGTLNVRHFQMIPGLDVKQL